MTATIYHFLEGMPLALAYVLGGFLSGLLVSAIVVIWGAVQGHYITNLSLNLETRRTSNDADNDHLVTVIKIDKGTMNALTLQSLRVELFSIEQDHLDQRVKQWQTLIPQPSGERRLGDIWVPQSNNRSINSAGTPCAECYILSIWTPEFERAENLAPTEKTQYACYSVVKANRTYEVIVTLTGIRYRSGPFKWLCKQLIFWSNYQPQKAFYTASDISPPIGVRR